MDRERTDAVWKKYGRSLWNFAGSYGLGIALMLILLVLTFAGTLHQVRLSSAMGAEAAIESFFASGGPGGTRACWWLMGEFCCCWPVSCWATK